MGRNSNGILLFGFLKKFQLGEQGEVVEIDEAHFKSKYNRYRILNATSGARVNRKRKIIFENSPYSLSKSNAETLIPLVNFLFLRIAPFCALMNGEAIRS